ncbi:MAG: hypothetical protein ACPLTR_10735 [Thermacetogeniaceae bacterium]
MERTCRVCSLAVETRDDGACFCIKYNRLMKPEETSWDWGCRYFSQSNPEEGYTPYQYLLIRETEFATRK